MDRHGSILVPMKGEDSQQVAKRSITLIRYEVVPLEGSKVAQTIWHTRGIGGYLFTEVQTLGIRPCPHVHRVARQLTFLNLTDVPGTQQGYGRYLMHAP